MATKNRFHHLTENDNELCQLIELHKNIKLANLEVMKKKSEEQAKIRKEKAEEEAKIMNEKAEEEAKIMKEKEEEAAKARRDWLELPHDVMSLIFIKLGPFNILYRAQFVCSSWQKLSKEPHLFRSIDLSNNYCFNGHLNKLVKEVVDRSCGQLVEFFAEGNYGFHSNKHLHYVVDKSIALKRLRFRSEYFSEEVLIEILRKAPFLEELGLYYSSWFSTVLVEAVGQFCPQLRCLQISCFGSYGGTPDDEALRKEVLIKLVRKLPFLEELELYYKVFSEELIKEVGRSCTQIKCLRLNKKMSIFNYNWIDRSSDEEAFAIADNIPQLRRLHLSACKLTNTGLEVMLNRCTNFEHLDIQSCKLVDLEGIEQMKKKCEESGITLRLPVNHNYSIDDEHSRRDCWSPVSYNIDPWDQDYEDYQWCLYQDKLYQEYLDSFDDAIFLPKKFHTWYL